MKYFLSLFFTAIVFTSSAQKIKSVNTSDFILECMKTNGEAPDRQMVLWFPYDFWQIVGEQMKVPPEFVQHLTTEMSRYMMFAVVDYHITSSGITFKSEDEIRSSIKFYDSSKKAYSPVATENISASAAKLLVNLQPTMAQMLGQFGEGMRIFLFDVKQSNGKPLTDLTKSNQFYLTWDKTDLKWTLPFGSVLPPKFCPQDHEQMKGNWNYCPVHGAKLDQ